MIYIGTADNIIGIWGYGVYISGWGVLGAIYTAPNYPHYYSLPLTFTQKRDRVNMNIKYAKRDIIIES